MKALRWLIPVVLVVAIGGIVAVNFGRSRSAAGQVSVRTNAVHKGDVVLKVSAPGTVAALQDVTLRTRVGAQLVDLKVKAGDRVKAGQVLARQDDRDLVSAVSQNEQAVASAESNLASLRRRTELAPQQNQQSLSSAALSLDQAIAALGQAQVKARHTLEQARIDLESLRQKEGNGQVPPDQFTRDLDKALLGVTSANEDLQALLNNSSYASGAVFQVRSAQAQLAKARLDVQSNAVLPEELASAETNVQTARTNSAAARQKLGDVVIVAPWDGTVLDVPAKQGDVLSAGAPVVTLGVLDSVLAKIRVDEVDIGPVQPQQLVSVTASAYAGTPFTGKVTEVAPQALAGNQAGSAAVVEVRAAIDNKEGKLRPGTSLDTEITTQQALGVLVLDASAIIERGDKKVVYVLSGDSVAETAVTLGLRGRTSVEITGGLKDGDQVVIGPFDALKKLKDGTKVKVEAPKGPTSGAPGASKP